MGAKDLPRDEGPTVEGAAQEVNLESRACGLLAPQFRPQRGTGERAGRWTSLWAAGLMHPRHEYACASAMM